MPAGPITGSPRRRVFLLCAVVVASVTALGCAELIARLVFPEWTPAFAERSVFWAHHDVLGWAHVPFQDGRFVHRDFSVDVRINSRGLRDDEYPLERTGKKRMLVLGDSFGWGFGVEARERFTEILEARHSGWEIINASVSGYSTDQELLFLTNGGMEYHPDVVLLLFYKNDFADNLASELDWHYKPFFSLIAGKLVLNNVPVPPSTWKQTFDRFFLGRTYLLARLYSSAYAVRQALGSWWRGDRAGGRRRGPRSTSDRFLVTTHLLRAVKDACASAGAGFVLVSVPMEAELRTHLSTFAAADAVPYLALDDDFTRVGEQVSFPHDAHWNPRGHQVAAAAIERFLVNVGVFP